MDYEEFLNEWSDKNNNFIVCRTSGSTGVPKEIRLFKDFVKQNALRTIEFFNLTKDSHLHSCVSPDFIGGKMMAVRAQLTGAKLSFENPSNRALSDYSGDDIDLLAVVPSQMLHIIENSDFMPRINAIIIGGAPISDELRKKIVMSGLNAYETYGMTETSSHIALRKVSSTPLPFRTLGDITVENDENGCLIINVPYIEGENVANSRFKTNDIAEVISSKEFRILGRSDNVIITGGKKVHPEEIEEILEKEFRCPIMIKGEPDVKWGERVVMVIEDNRDASFDREIIKICKRILPGYAVPKQIRHDKLNLTPNGKKKRN